jgi:hypothetical protein
MELPNFADLPITALATYLVLIAATDVIFNIVLSVVHGDFSAAYVADFLRTHVLLRVFIIAALGVFGHGVPALGVPAIPAVSLAATGGLAAYLAETVMSLVTALKETNPAPEPPTPTPSG